MLDFIVNDFQSLTDVKIRVEGLTLLVGESSSGKSACLRALYAATNNRFRNGQVQYGKDHSTVKVRVPESSDILTVVRPYSGSVSMKLGNQTFSKLGRTIPQQVSQFLNLGSLELADDKYSLTFHDQFQKPLLLEYSQKKVMELLSASKSLDDLNLCKDVTQKARQENKGAFKAVDAILTETKESLSLVKTKVEALLPLQEKLSALEDLFISLDLEQEMLLDLDTLLKELRTQETLLSLSNSVLDLSKSLCGIDTELQDYKLLKSQLLLLGEVNQDISLRSALLDKCDLELVSSVECLSKLSAYLSTSTILSADIERTKSKVDSLKEIVSVQTESTLLGTNVSNLYLLQSYLSQQEALSSSIEDLSNVLENKLCPLCHSKLE